MNLEFRVWDSQSKRFRRSNIDGPQNTVWGLKINRGIFQLPNTSKLTNQLSTGALDKHQQKIFEGDIVLFDNPDPYDGQDQLTKIVGYNSRVMGFRLYNFTHEINKYGGTVFFPEQVEVIGNIFEGAVKDGINYGEYLKET